jgi:hypothetical protein
MSATPADCQYYEHPIAEGRRGSGGIEGPLLIMTCCSCSESAPFSASGYATVWTGSYLPALKRADSEQLYEFDYGRPLPTRAGALRVGP